MSNGAESQGQVVMERSRFLHLIGPDERSDRGLDALLHASRNNLASSRVRVCVCVWTEDRKKKHKRIGEQESYVDPFIADSAVLVKVTAHLLADIQPVCSYTLPSRGVPMATAPACWVRSPYS